MIDDLSQWTPRPRPSADVLDGQWCRLERLSPERHAADLFEASIAPGADQRYRYLPEEPPSDRAAFDEWIAAAAASNDPLYFAVLDKSTGRAEGRQTLMRITPEHGVIEIGNILWGPRIARSRVATEALYLFAEHVFDALGYRRFEWKCNAANEPSRRSALRFGFLFEGVFRNHMIVKGRNRDTAWYAMTDGDWPAIRARFTQWLDASNFGDDGAQVRRLTEI